MVEHLGKKSPNFHKAWNFGLRARKIPRLHLPYQVIPSSQFHTVFLQNSFSQIYGLELWGCSKPSNTKILQTFQSKMLSMISSAPWYVSNQILHSDFEIQYVTEVVRINANKYKNRSTEHGNQLRGLLKTLIRQTTQTIMAGRLSPIEQLHWTTDGWCLPHDFFLPQPY